MKKTEHMKPSKTTKKFQMEMKNRGVRREVEVEVSHPSSSQKLEINLWIRTISPLKLTTSLISVSFPLFATSWHDHAVERDRMSHGGQPQKLGTRLSYVPWATLHNDDSNR